MPKISLVVVLICAGAFQACTLWGEHPVKNWTDVTGGESLERNFWMEVKAKNWAELEKHVAGNFITASVAGTKDKAGALERLKQLQVDDFSIGDVQVEFNGESLVVTYGLTLKGSAGGSPLTGEPRRMMSVWQKQKSGWVIIAHSTLGQPTN
jgi:ketosteroid isomerase-like protein